MAEYPERPSSSHRDAPLTSWPRRTTTTSASANDTKHCPDDHRLPICPVVDAHDQLHQGEAHEGKRALFEQERVGVFTVLAKDDSGGAVDHHHAGAHERQHRDEQPFVRFQFSRHNSPPKGRKRSSREMSRSYERSAVISRTGIKTPPSQAGAACVPSGRFFIAPPELMTAHCSRTPFHSSFKRATSCLKTRPRSA